MTDQVNIANQAIFLCSGKRITSFDDGTTEANAVTEFYNSAKEATLQDYPWPFAQARAELAEDATPPAFGFNYSYTLPSDFLSVVELPQLDQVDDWTVEGNKLLCNIAGPLQLIYTTDVDESVMTGQFVKCFAAYLASEITLKINESQSRQGQLFQIYQARLRDAMIHNARNRKPRRVQSAGRLLKSRLTYGV